MHTTEVEYEGETFTCHHNGDFSGDVKVYVHNDRLSEGWEPDTSEVDIPFEVMKELVASWLRHRIVATYEDIDADELYRQIVGTPFRPVVIESLSDLQREMMDEHVSYPHDGWDTASPPRG